MKHLLNITALFLLVAAISCKGPSKDDSEDTPKDSVVTKALLPNNFSSDSAYEYVAKQVSFGPRVPNTEAHRKCSAWLESMLKKWADTVFVQSFDSKNGTGQIMKAKNLIGSFNPNNPDRLLLCAHWDTRPQADQDKTNPTTPADGANDGGSGVGVLLEIARQLHLVKPEMGIDIIFFDVEDGGSNSNETESTWCLGSKYWAEHPHVMDYMAKNGILLDMVGSKNALFAREEMSAIYDNNFLGKVWQTGANIGFGSFFSNYNKDGITDDHVNVSTLGHVPTIDIIDYSSATQSGFGAYWHTHDDNMSIISKFTLNAVGKTVLQVVLNDEANVE